MNCPVCKRELAPTLSICLTCGAMMNDTVREELEGKIGRGSGPLTVMSDETPTPEPPAPKTNAVSGPLPPALRQKIAPARSMTADLPPKRTSPTLVDFQPKNATLPDWRLQLQNAVRQRAGGSIGELTAAEPPPQAVQRQAAATNGHPAGNADLRKRAAEHSNETVANALRRIDASRRAFLPNAKPSAANSNGNSAPAKNYPFDVVAPVSPPRPQAAAPAVASQKPRLVSSLRIEKKAYDTNKLPPIPKPAEISSSFDNETEPALAAADASTTSNAPIPIGEIEIVDDMDLIVAGEIEEIDDFDDLAPFSMRFGSGLFDLILSSISTLIILSPFMIGGGSWLSLSGVLAFTATLAIFHFLYMTASIGFWGRTFGMRIFSLELIDAEQNAVPTVHQAAVSSAVYLLSMTFAGIGFLTIPFNEEKRAFHDIVSGTLLIRDI